MQMQDVINELRRLFSGGSGTAAAALTPTQGTPTDRSGTITAGGTAQVLAAANATRKYIEIQNLSTGDLWFEIAGADAVQTQPSFRLQAGQSWNNPPHFCPTGAISIVGGTNGQAFAAKEF